MIPPFPRTAAFDRGRLVAVGGVDVDALADEYGTPLYVLDRTELEARMRGYREAFGADTVVAYAAKALCVTGVLQIAAANGLHLDVASAGELHTAVRAGFPMQRVIFHGNNKSRGELERAAELGVGRIVADSFTELHRLEDVGRHARHRFAVALRVTPGITAGGHEFVRTGVDDTKFGFTLSAGLAHEAVRRAVALDHVELVGLHCHLGSQIAASAAAVAAAEAMVDLLAEVRDRDGVVLGELNLGGGMGIVYEPDTDQPEALEGYADAVLGAVQAACDRHRLPRPRLVVEPGRSIAGPAGLTLYRVGTVKDIPGVRTYVSVDGGMSDNLRPALYGARYTFCAAGRPRGGAGAAPHSPAVGEGGGEGPPAGTAGGGAPAGTAGGGPPGGAAGGGPPAGAAGGGAPAGTAGGGPPAGTAGGGQGAEAAAGPRQDAASSASPAGEASGGARAGAAGGARGKERSVDAPSAEAWGAAPERPVTVAGKHCESGDVLGRDVVLPADLAEGDLLAVAATGAYAHSMASNYNRLPRPAMVLVADGEVRLLVRRESLDDVLSCDVRLGDG